MSIVSSPCNSFTINYGHLHRIHDPTHAQCRKGRIQRNHIACAMLVWVGLKHIANKTGKTVYQLKRELLNEYLVQQLRNPAISMANA